jgi:two-component system response regulator YesN
MMQENDYPPVRLDPDRPFDRIRELYLYEEPALLASIRRGDRKEATRIINLVLVHIYSAGAERSDLLKGLLLELIVMMSRAAVEVGAPQSEVLGFRFQHLTELAAIGDDEHLARWLRESVLRIFEAVERHREFETPLLVTKILGIIREEACGPVTRAAVARRAGVSGTRLAELLRERTGRTFTQLVREARIERACELLGNPDTTVASVASACGFCDQSHFTHVFHDLKKTTPKQYRNALIQNGKTQKKRL